MKIIAYSKYIYLKLMKIFSSTFFIYLAKLLFIGLFFSGCGGNQEQCYCDNTRVVKLKLQWRIYFNENGCDIVNEETIFSLYQVAYWIRQNPKVRLSVTGNSIPKVYENDIDRQSARDLRRARVQSVYNILQSFDQYDTDKLPIAGLIDYHYFDETITVPSQNPKEYMSCDIQVILVDDYNKIPSAKSIISGLPIGKLVEDVKKAQRNANIRNSGYPASNFIDLQIN